MAGLKPGTTYHFRTVATNSVKVQLEKPNVEFTRMGADMEFTTAASKSKEKEAEKEEKEEPKTVTEEPPTGGGGSTTTPTGGGSANTPPTIGPSPIPGAIPAAVATTPKAVEELLLGCSKSAARPQRRLHPRRTRGAERQRREEPGG